MSKRNNKRVSKYGIDLGKRGIYDRRNKLNELTGKEWVFFTNSVWITGYSPTASENVGLKYRKIHPSPKPPGLLKDIICFFTKRGGRILDPFAGVGGSMLGAALAGGNRIAVGIDLEPVYKRAYLKACKSENIQTMPFFVGDSFKILSFKYKEFINKFDLVIADPPYSDMMNRSRTGQKLKLYNHKGGTPYSISVNDLGNMERNTFLSKFKEIMEKSTKMMKSGSYMIVFCKDLQPVGKNPNLLHSLVVDKLNEIEDIEYKGMRIWHDQAMSLYPFGYPFSFVMNQIHQYILIFRKAIKPRIP